MTVHLGARVADLVDGQLDHRTRDWALAHIAHCDLCRTEVDAQRRLKARIARLDAPMLPPDLADKLAHMALSPQELADRARERAPERGLPLGFGVAAFTGGATAAVRRMRSDEQHHPGSRTRRVLAGGVFMLAVGAGGAFALGGGGGSSGPANQIVTPAVARYVNEQGRTETGWSFNEPALTLVSTALDR